MLLTDLLDIVSSDTNIILYLDGKRIGMCKVYNFPSRHELNQYYGNKVKEVMPVDILKLEIYL